jgi:hypothetical protein
MKLPKLVALLAAAASITFAHAQAPWTAETTSFRTVEIGTSAASIPECPKRKHKFLSHEEYIPSYDEAYPSEAKDKLCWKSTTDKPLIPGAKSLIIANVPFIKGAGREVTVTVIDDRIESIDSRFLSEHAQAFQQALVERFGQPTRREQHTFQNRLGAKFSGVSLAWYGKQVTLTFDEVDGSSDWGLISMRSLKFDAALKASTSSTTESIKKGF